MSQFNHYAKEAEEAVKQAVEKMVAVKADYDTAEKKMNAMPAHNYQRDPVYQAKATLARDEWQKQMDRLRSARRDLPDELERDLKRIRQQLEADLTVHFTPSPDQVEGNMLEIAKSGILSIDEYTRMIEDAIGKGNHTMARLIGRYAEDALQAEVSKNGNSRATALLRTSIARIRQTGPSAWLDTFDAIVDTALRSVKNPSLMNHWERLLGDVIKNF